MRIILRVANVDCHRELSLVLPQLNIVVSLTILGHEINQVGVLLSKVLISVVRFFTICYVVEAVRVLFNDLSEDLKHGHVLVEPKEARNHFFILKLSLIA